MLLHLMESPLSWFLLAAAGAWWAGAARRRTRWLMAGAAATSLAFMTPLGANLMVGALEQRAVTPDAACSAEPPQTIVVLGGGLDHAPSSADDLEALSPHSMRRTVTAWQLWTHLPQSRVVIAGGGPFRHAESTVMAALARKLGIAPEQITVETRSMNTAENLANLAGLQPEVDRRIWLVTSAMHLPRAMATARRAGFQPCAKPADFRYVPPGGLGYYLPQSSSLDKAEDAIHEAAGLLVYALRAELAGARRPEAQGK